jgi:hypothetical protein
MPSYGTDPIILAAEAREILAGLHKRNDTIVRFRTNRSGYSADALTKLDEKLPGHFNDRKKELTFNLDDLLNGKPLPASLGSVEQWRLYPILAGVAAHESGHARWSRWDSDEHPLPASIPNPDFDPAHAEPKVERDVEVPITRQKHDPRLVSETNPGGLLPDDTLTDEEWFSKHGQPVPSTRTVKKMVNDPDYKGPEFYPVQRGGKLLALAALLEEPRVERLGLGNFTKTWQRALPFAATHLVLERVDEDDAEGKDALMAAVGLAVVVGGRQIVGTLGTSHESRANVRRILESVKKIIETAMAEKMANDSKFDPYHEIMGIIATAVFSDSHYDATPHLEAARRILKVLEPEKQDDPDEPEPDDEGEDGEGEGGEAPNMGMTSGGAGSSAQGDKSDEESEGGGSGEDEDDSESEDGDAGEPESEQEKSDREARERLAQEAREQIAKALAEAKQELSAAIDKMADDGKREAKEEAEQQQGPSGVGPQLSRDRNAPPIERLENPNAEDRALYRKAQRYFESQIQPTVTQAEIDQWMPGGGARLDVRNFIRDNVAGNVATKRHDWSLVSETVKPAPPVKLGIMLDGSGSMSSRARWSASVGWAAANAAADLPEALTTSIVYGNAAGVTQKPGHDPVKQVAVASCNGSWENFPHAVELLEENLRLNEPTEDGEPTNVSIIIVSDLIYRDVAIQEFNRKTKEWAEKGYNILVVGIRPEYDVESRGIDLSYVTVTTAEDLFN